MDDNAKEEISKMSPDDFRERVEQLGIRGWKKYYTKGSLIMDGGDWEISFSSIQERDTESAVMLPFRRISTVLRN